MRSTLFPFRWLKLINEELMQSKNRAISGDDVTESVELIADRMEDSDYL
jgi:hypothetical protein